MVKTNTEKLKISDDVIVFPATDEKWIIFNVFTKTSVGVNNETLEILRFIENNLQSELIQNINKKFLIWEIERFSNEDGLLADPTRFLKDVKNWSEPLKFSIEELIQEFQRKFILIDDIKKYMNVFQPKKSLLDKEHLGNFHQQLGQHLMLNRRESPSSWWLKQKFKDDLSTTKNNLYRAVQTYFLQHYIPKRFHKGDNVIDLGCGIGYYSKMISETGANVLGLDPSEEYVTLAKKNNSQNLNFETANIGIKGELNKIPSSSADFIFMSDALLFYFVHIDTSNKPDLDILFSDIRRMLKPEGIFISLEPHYNFWLLPWLGSNERPFTVITEYNVKSFGVTPNFSQLIKSFTQGGFAIINMEELYPDPSFESIDTKAYHFANQFPLWQLFELKKK